MQGVVAMMDGVRARALYLACVSATLTQPCTVQLPLPL